MKCFIRRVACRFVWSCAAVQMVRGNDDDRKSVKRIAIIGAGIGGTSCAYFLSQLSTSSYSVDLYEPNSVCGRIATVKVANEKYECGAAIIHPENKYLKQLANETGLNVDKYGSGLLGIFNGKKFVFLENGSPFVTLARLFWRYWFNTTKLATHINDIDAKFSNIYRLQASGVAFNSVPEMLRSISPDFTESSQSLREYFYGKGFSGLFIDEFLTAISAATCGHSTCIPPLVGSSVNLTAATPRHLKIFGGNRQIPERLLQKSNARLIPNRVNCIAREADGKYTLESVDKNGDPHMLADYDAVVLAFPLVNGQENNLKTENLPSLCGSYGGYHQTVVTFVKGKIRSRNWGRKASKLPQNVLSCDGDLFYSSIAQWLPVDWRKGDRKIWKIVSPEPLNVGQIDALFERVDDKSESVWVASRPNFEEKPERMDFELADNLYYINAAEWAASAMEMGVIGARNVALLIDNKFKQSSSGDFNSGYVDDYATELY